MLDPEEMIKLDLTSIIAMIVIGASLSGLTYLGVEIAARLT